MTVRYSWARWLKRLLVVLIALLVGLIVFGYYGLAPLAETAIRRALDSETFSSSAFRVTTVGPRQTVLEDVDIASRGWRLQTPKLVARYGFQEVQEARLWGLDISQGILTLNLDELFGETTESGKPPSSSGKSSSGSQAIFPFNALLVDGLTLVFLKDGREERFKGTVSISNGASVTAAEWSIRLEQGEHRLVGAGTLNPSRQPEQVSLRSTNADLIEWVSFAGYEEGWWGIPLRDVTVGASQLELVRSEGADSWSLQSAFDLELHHDEKKAVTRSVMVDALFDADGLVEGTGRAELVSAKHGPVALSDGAVTAQFTKDRVNLSLTRHPTISVGEQLTGTIAGSFSVTDGTWHADMVAETLAVFGQDLEGIMLTAESLEEDAAVLRIPEIAYGKAKLQSIEARLSSERITATAAHMIDYGQGEIYGPVPVTLSGDLLDDTWALRLVAKTTESLPWQTYWRGLGFSLEGAVEADWQIDKPSIVLRSSLTSADVRRNESAITVKSVGVEGTLDVSAKTLALSLKGMSSGIPFTGDIKGFPTKDGRQIDYRISKLTVQENTVLGAFAEALTEMPMAAFLDATGNVVLPESGEVTHRLDLKLARGVYRHPERKLAGSGIAGNFAIESFDPFVTVDDQQATFAVWRMGDLELRDGKFLYKLGPQGAVLIKEAQAEGIGGLLTMKSLSSHPGEPDFESVVTFTKIELAKLAELIPGFKGRVGGKVSGQVRLRFRDGILSLPQGSLVLDELSEAYLSLNAKEALGAQLSDIAQDPSALQIVEAALKDLIVHELEIGFFDPDVDASVCRIRLKGRSREEVPIPQTEGGKAFAPIHLNINVDDPSELVRRLLNFGLRKQLNTKLKPSR